MPDNSNSLCLCGPRSVVSSGSQSHFHSPSAFIIFTRATVPVRIGHRKYLRPQMKFILPRENLPLLLPGVETLTSPGTAWSFLNHPDDVNLEDKSL